MPSGHDVTIGDIEQQSFIQHDLPAHQVLLSTGVDWCSKAGIAASTGDYSATTLLTAMKKMDWFNYEVDPDWRGFCEFGPEDIGGVWEKLGVIRKRDPVKMAIVASDVAAVLDKKMADQILYGIPSYGLPVYVDPYLPRGSVLFGKHRVGSWGDT